MWKFGARLAITMMAMAIAMAADAQTHSTSTANLDALRARAEQGDAQAPFSLGLACYNGTDLNSGALDTLLRAPDTVTTQSRPGPCRAMASAARQMSGQHSGGLAK